MVWRWLSLALLAAAVAAAAAAPADNVEKINSKVRFDGFRVYRVVPTTQEQVRFLRELEKLGDEVHLWTSPALNTPVDVMVSPEQSADVLDRVRAAGLTTSVYVENVQKLIDEEKSYTPFADGYDWQNYYPLPNLNEWLRSLPDQFPEASLIDDIGKSYEERDILGIKISKKEGNSAIFVESGIHAREWITVAVTTYLINELLNSQDSRIQKVAKNFDWYIVPSTNPDGYQYSHDYNRLWRKTRSKGTTCNGVDGNRNWDYMWNDTDGSSSNECSETYRGASVFSEIEFLKLSEYLQGLNDLTDLLVYFCIHSYSQVLMVPYGLGEEPSNYEVLEPMGKAAIKALQEVHGTSYGFGTISDAIGYKASGGSMDWVKSKLNTTYTFEWELRDKGRYGFLLPANQIISTAEETIVSMLSILEKVSELEEIDLQ